MQFNINTNGKKEKGMTQSTHVLDLKFGVDFSKIASSPYIKGIMMALNIQEEEELIEVYGKHLHDIIIGSIEGREEIFPLEAKLIPLEQQKEEYLEDDDQGWEDEYEEELDISSPTSLYEQKENGLEEDVEHDPFVESKAVSDHFTNMINESLEEISYMKGVEIDRVLVREGIYIDTEKLKALKDKSVNFRMDISSFEEDRIDSGFKVPYKIILKDLKNKDNETVIVGGY